MITHSNKNDQPLCGKLNWISDGDNLKSTNVNCTECMRILRSEEWNFKTDKEKTYLYFIKNLLKIFSEEIEDMIVHGDEVHPYKNYPKTEKYIKENMALSNIPYISYFIDCIQKVIEHASCKHKNIKRDEVNKKEICNDCKWERIWWISEIKSDYDYGPPIFKEVYSKWSQTRISL